MPATTPARPSRILRGLSFGGHGLLAVAAATVALPGSGHAQLAPGSGGDSTLPATGTNVRLGDLRQQVEALVRPPLLPAAGAPAFIIIPSIGGSLGLTDNARGVTGTSPDVFALLTPSVSATVDTARIKGTLNYTPQASVYAATSGRNYIDQNLTANALGTVVPNAVFVDMRASISEQARTGALSSFGGLTTPAGDRTQNTAVVITPYAVHRFGGLGTAQVSYGLSYTADSGNTGNGANNFFNNNFTNLNNTAINTAPFGSGNTYNPYFASQNVFTNHERAQFTTGENLGRINAEIAADAKQFSGNGIYQGAYRNLVTLDGAYALDRQVAIIGRVGYEALHYGGVPPFSVSGPVWYAGFRWEPNADSTIVARYGRRDGIDSAYLDATYAPTANTKFFATYSAGLTSEAEEQQSLLALANFDPGGFATSAGTGAPLADTGSFFGEQNTLYVLRRFSATGVLLRPRDTYSVTVTHETQHVVAGSSALAGGNATDGTFGSISWSHALSPKLSSLASLRYGVNRPLQVLGVSQDTLITANAALSYSISPTLTTSLSYIFTNRSGSGANNRGFTEDILLVGFQKGF